MYSVVKGVGAHLPERVLTNKDLETMVDTSDEWIVARTGITQRHIAAEGELTSDLGAKAAQDALHDAGLSAKDIDLVIVATTTPDETMPSTASRIQAKLGIEHGAAFDLNAACSGFVYALTVADSLLKAGQGKRALVIGAETYSRILDWNDRSTCILFGDGAGAIVLEYTETNARRGVIYASIQANGKYGDLLATTGGVSKTKEAGTLFMSGKEIFRHAVSKMSRAIEDGLSATGHTAADIDLLVPHQANLRIMSSIAQKLGLKDEQVISTVHLHANTSAASIPLALAHAKKAGKLEQEQLIALPALGAGLTWGSCIIIW